MSGCGHDRRWAACSACRFHVERLPYCTGCGDEWELAGRPCAQCSRGGPPPAQWTSRDRMREIVWAALVPGSPSFTVMEGRIFPARRGGARFTDLAAKYSLSPTRIRQIYERAAAKARWAAMRPWRLP